MIFSLSDQKQQRQEQAGQQGGLEREHARAQQEALLEAQQAAVAQEAALAWPRVGKEHSRTAKAAAAGTGQQLRVG